MEHLQSWKEPISLGVRATNVQTRVDKHPKSWRIIFAIMDLRETTPGGPTMVKPTVWETRSLGNESKNMTLMPGLETYYITFHEAHFDEGRREEEEPEATAKAYYDMLAAAQQSLHGHTAVSQLDAIACLMTIKS